MHSSMYRECVHRYATRDCATPDNRLHQKLFHCTQMCSINRIQSLRSCTPGTSKKMLLHAACQTKHDVTHELMDQPEPNSNHISINTRVLTSSECKLSHAMPEASTSISQNLKTEMFETHSIGIHMSSQPKWNVSFFRHVTMHVYTSSTLTMVLKCCMLTTDKFNPLHSNTSPNMFGDTPLFFLAHV